MKKIYFIFLIILPALAAVPAPAGGWEAGQNPLSGAVIYRVFLPAVRNYPLTPPFDMNQFLIGDRRLYEVQHSSGSQARHQTQIEGNKFFHTKGENTAEWEELWSNGGFIYRGTDTSPGSGMYYTLRDGGVYGSRWSPRVWNVGDIFERNPGVTFYRKSDCSVVTGGTQRSYLKFEAYYPNYQFESGLTLTNVIQLAWLLDRAGQPEERYFYAELYGLVGWWSRTNGMSYISEIHNTGARPDNRRESIPCLDQAPFLAQRGPEKALPYWPGNHRR